MSTTSQQAESQAYENAQRYAVHPGSRNLHALRPWHSLLQMGTDGPPRCYCGSQPPADRGWADTGTDPYKLDYDGEAAGCILLSGGGR